MNSREHIDLLVLLIKQLFQLADLCLQESYALFERLCVTSGKRATAELIAGLALEANVGALCATRANAIAAYLLRTASIACLCDAGLAARPDFDNFHG
jgi:hypothetical protein